MRLPALLRVLYRPLPITSMLLLFFWTLSFLHEEHGEIESRLLHLTVSTQHGTFAEKHPFVCSPCESSRPVSIFVFTLFYDMLPGTKGAVVADPLAFRSSCSIELHTRMVMYVIEKTAGGHGTPIDNTTGEICHGLRVRLNPQKGELA